MTRHGLLAPCKSSFTNIARKNVKKKGKSKVMKKNLRNNQGLNSEGELKIVLFGVAAKWDPSNGLTLKKFGAD